MNNPGKRFGTSDGRTLNLLDSTIEERRDMDGD
jgi:hypothetical protein